MRTSIKSALSVRHRSAQDPAPGRAVAASRMEALAADRRAGGMRIPLPAARLGPGLPLRQARGEPRWSRGTTKREERRGAAERYCGNGSATDGRAWAHGLDPRVGRGQEAPWRLPFPTPRDSVSRTHALGGSKEQIRDTVLHEIAHAIAGREAGHGPLWKVTARRIEATPRAKAYESQARLRQR